MRSLSVLFLLCLCFLPLITCTETETETQVEQHHDLTHEQQQQEQHLEPDLIALESSTSVDTREQMDALMAAEADVEAELKAELEMEMNTDNEIDIDSEADTESDSSIEHQQELESEHDASITLDHSTHQDTDHSIDAMLENANEALLEMNAESESEQTLEGELDAEAEIDSESELNSELDTDLSTDAETDAEMTMETDIENEMDAFLNSETDSEATSDAELEVHTETGVDTDADMEYYNTTHRCNGRTHRIPQLSWGRALFMNGKYVGRLPGGVTPLWIPLRGPALARRSRRDRPRKLPKTMNLVLTTIPTRNRQKRYDFLKWVAASHRRHPFRATIQVLEFGLTKRTRNHLKLLTFHRTQLISVRWPGHRNAHANVPKGFRHLKTFPQFKIKSHRLEIEVSRRNQDKSGQKHIATVLSSRAPIWPRTSLSLLVRGKWDSRSFPISLERTPTSPTPRVTSLEYSFARYHRFQLWVSRYEQRHGRLPRALYDRLKYKFEQSLYWIQHKQEKRGTVHPLQNITVIGTVACRLLSTLGHKALISSGPLKSVSLQYTYRAPGTLISIQAQKIVLHTAVVAELGRGRAGINLSIGYSRARIRRSQTIRPRPRALKKAKRAIQRVIKKVVPTKNRRVVKRQARKQVTKKQIKKNNQKKSTLKNKFQRIFKKPIFKKKKKQEDDDE